MINLMYLVLTALLALNVSAEILNAFKTVDASLMTANATIDAKNESIFKSFEKKLEDEKTRQRAEIWKPKADQAKKLADDMYRYLNDLKLQMKKEADLEIVDGVEHYKEDNLDAATRMMVENKKGDELQKRLEKFKQDLLAIDPEIKANFLNGLPIDTRVPKTVNEGNNTWSAAYFRMTPTIAAVTILSKFQNDIRNSEAMVVDFCHRKVGEVEVVFDAFQAFAGTNSTYLMPGQELQISAGVGAFSKKALPTVTVDGSPVALNDQGVAEYKTTVGQPGNYVKTVKVTFTKPDGTVDVVEKKVEYAVGKPTSITVSADAVKVLYVGLDNPISVIGGSKGAEKIQASIDQGSLTPTGKGGQYIARVTTPGKATITVKDDEGKSERVEFKVRTVPPPVAKIGPSAGGRMSVNVFKAQAGVRADLENFIFEGVRYDVESFTMITTGKGFENSGPQVSQNSGPYFTADTKRIMEMCKPGSTVILDRIVVKGPSGRMTLQGSPAFNLTN